MYVIQNNTIIFENDYNGTDFVKIIEKEYFINKDINEIRFGTDFNQNIFLIPNYIKKIMINTILKKKKKSLRSSINYLFFNERIEFNKPIDHLPVSLTHLTLGENFNQPIDHLPESLTHLILGKKFNQPIDNLPIGLIDLEFHFYSIFNQPLNNLPPNISRLIFARKFNQPLYNLPPKLKILGFYCCSLFNHRIDIDLENLTHLSLGKSFNKPIKKFPKNLVYLSIYDDYIYPINISKNVKIHVYSDKYYSINPKRPQITEN